MKANKTNKKFTSTKIIIPTKTTKMVNLIKQPITNRSILTTIVPFITEGMNPKIVPLETTVAGRKKSSLKEAIKILNSIRASTHILTSMTKTAMK